jgi:hypothetical protein
VRWLKYHAQAPRAREHSTRIRLPRLRFWGSVPLRKAPGCVGSFVMWPVSWETSAATAFLSPVLDNLESTSTATSCTLGSLSCRCLMAGGRGHRPSAAPRGYFQEPALGLLPFHGTARQTGQRTEQNDTLTYRNVQTRLGVPDHVQLGASHQIVRRTGQRDELIYSYSTYSYTPRNVQRDLRGQLGAPDCVENTVRHRTCTNAQHTHALQRQPHGASHRRRRRRGTRLGRSAP